MATPEARELSLINKVELRIALADSDLKLEAVLKTYLAPLLLKLASEHVGVRNKVISICHHINTRVKPPSIKLPVAALLKQFKEHPSTPLIRHFDLTYVQQGLDRLPAAERIELFPVLINGLADDESGSGAHGATLFNLLLRLLPQFPLPPRGSKEDSELRKSLGLSERPLDAKFLSTWFGKVILLTLGRSGEKDGPSNAAQRCPGISTDEYAFLTLGGKPETWAPEDKSGMNLVATKIAIARFVSSGAFVDEERFLLALFASADSNSRISDIGDDILKRTLPYVSLEDHALIDKLFHIYFGSSEARGPPPVKPALQTKILGLLSKSATSTTFVTNIMRVVEEGITPSTVADENAGAVSSSPGREASKLRGAIFSFTNWVARMGSAPDLRSIAPTLVYKLRDYIEHQGWPSPSASNEGARSSAEMSLRGYAYESIGLLAKTSLEELLLDPNMDLLRWLFRSLSEEGSGESIYVSIEEGISSVIGALSGDMDMDVTEALRSLLLQHMELQVGDDSPSGDGSKIRRSTCFVAVRFANRCLSYSDVVGRWIDLLAIGSRPGERSDVAEEGKKGLDPHWYRMLNPGHGTPASVTASAKYIFPDIAELVLYIFGTHVGEERILDDASRISSLQSQQAHVLEPAIAYCRRVLLTQALEQTATAPAVGMDWERKLDAMVSADEIARKNIRDFLKNIMLTESALGARSIMQFLHAIFNGLIWNHGEGLGRCGEYFVELCALSTNKLVRPLVGRVRELGGAILSSNFQTRSTASHALGILASHSACSDEEVQRIVGQLLQTAETWRRAIGAEVNKAHGSILALGYLFSRLSFRRRLNSVQDATLMAFKSVALSIVEDSKDSLLREAAFLAIGQLAIFSALSPIPVPHTADLIIAKLAESAKAGNEKAVAALGRLAIAFMGDGSGRNRLCDTILDHIFKLHELRQPELQFSVGETLSCVAAGWSSKALVMEVDIEGDVPSTVPCQRRLSEIMDKVLEDAKNTKPALRKAACIWLLCLVQYCAHLPEVQERLRLSQAAFKGFLSDRDELIQETASRGLTLVYEKGDKDVKDDLVRDLVSSFTGNTANLSGNVTAETELFEPGTLPTGEGKGVTTYKDIMSLASEVGDPSLVYRFMSLASNSAIWSSRAAFGRFGLGSILSDSSIDGYLSENPKLYPKLFRYRFDPNPTVQKSMGDIWAALVKDSSATIDTHFDSIMEDLLRSIVGKEWRVREASCAAIADLVQGRPLAKYEKYLSSIWALGFKVLDDIKESVRVAAMGLCRTLTASLIRSVETSSSSSPKDANAMLENVMPFLMSTSGLEASAQEVQMFALDTVLKLITSAGNKLRPFIPDLVSRLLGLLSSLEPATINYLHLNASKYNLTEEKIDAARLMSIRSSPIMDAIENCLDLVDEPTMSKLIPSLENSIKESVGMPSKVGCGRVLVTLATRHNYLFRPHADSFLKAAEKAVLDRNDTVSSSYATAAGYLCRVSSDNQILRLAEFSHGDIPMLFLTFSIDERKRSVSGDIIYSISKYSSDRFLNLGVDFLPFVFIAKHDSDEHIKEYFEKTWSENVGGARAVLLYLQEIIDLCMSHLESPRWVVKHASALAIADIVVSAGNELNPSSAEKIWPALEQAIGGKTWSGKEKILEAFVLFANTGSGLWKERPDIANQITKITLREAKRNNPIYHQQALRLLGQYSEIRDDVDLFPEVYNIVSSTIEALLDESKESEMDIDSTGGGHSSKTIQEITAANGISALFQSLQPSYTEGPEIARRLESTLTLTEKANVSATIAVQNATAEGLKDTMDKFYVNDSSVIPADRWDGVLRGVLRGMGPLEDGPETLRGKRASCIEALAKVLGKVYTGELSEVRSLLQDEVDRAASKERSPPIKTRLQRTRDELLKLGKLSGEA
ncbi:MAG: proteasome component M29 [Geoglossum umbratile]|nr:MAG: proteasome component M29 [Geoglossum umbratile]